jgi:hypothetical protein
MKTIAGDETDATPLCVGTAGLRGGLLLEKMKPGLLSWWEPGKELNLYHLSETPLIQRLCQN